MFSLRACRRMWMVLALVSVSGWIGCDRGPSAGGSGGVAVVDLEQIANAIGRDAYIQQQLQAVQGQVEARLTALREQLQNDLTSRQKQLGEHPTPKQQQELTQAAQQAEQHYRQEVMSAQQFAQRTQATLISRLREEVRPLAEQVARARGMSIVMLRNELILSVDPGMDITLDVIQQMRAAGLDKQPASPVTQPTLDTPNPLDSQPATPMNQPGTSPAATQPRSSIQLPLPASRPSTGESHPESPESPKTLIEP
ncbi:MAG: OmpH family outer membrane protein [Phycisphaeraceae bacterium]|nr:OmpH family outer membrane protein [Phycisphaeraceae bacterium]